jgi:hypothetical protein
VRTGYLIELESLRKIGTGDSSAFGKHETEIIAGFIRARLAGLLQVTNGFRRIPFRVLTGQLVAGRALPPPAIHLQDCHGRTTDLKEQETSQQWNEPEPRIIKH